MKKAFNSVFKPPTKSPTPPESGSQSQSAQSRPPVAQRQQSSTARIRLLSPEREVEPIEEISDAVITSPDPGESIGESGAGGGGGGGSMRTTTSTEYVNRKSSVQSNSSLDRSISEIGGTGAPPLTMAARELASSLENLIAVSSPPESDTEELIISPATGERQLVTRRGGRVPLRDGFAQARMTATQLMHDKYTGDKRDQTLEEFRQRRGEGDDDTADVREVNRMRKVSANLEGDGFTAAKSAQARSTAREIRGDDGKSLTQEKSATKKATATFSAPGIQAEKKTAFSSRAESRSGLTGTGNTFSESRSSSSSSSSTTTFKRSTSSTGGAMTGILPASIMGTGMKAITANGSTSAPSSSVIPFLPSPIMEEPFSEDALSFAKEIGIEFEHLEDLVTHHTIPTLNMTVQSSTSGGAAATSGGMSSRMAGFRSAGSMGMSGSGGGGSGSGNTTPKAPGSPVSISSVATNTSHKSDANITRSMSKLEGKMETMVRRLKATTNEKDRVDIMRLTNEMLTKAWNVKTCGDDLGFRLASALRTSGGLQLLIDYMTAPPLTSTSQTSTDAPDEGGDGDGGRTKATTAAADESIRFLAAQILEQCLISDNRTYVVDHGLATVVTMATELCRKKSATQAHRVGVGILQHLFKHSEETCQDIIAFGGLQEVVNQCRASDIETLRRCAAAISNLALYGGTENQASMISMKVPDWLFPLAFQQDEYIQYYACLAIAVLVANKEIEASVTRSGTLELVEPFILTHNPEAFATSSSSHIHGHAKEWLARLVPVLASKRPEAVSLAAFHFAMEAWIKVKQGRAGVFREISSAVEVLQRVAGSPNKYASRYAAQVLRLIGEATPHRLSEQVPVWTSEDVKEWVRSIGFGSYSADFVAARVDGDLLLQMDDEALRADIGMKNGLLRKRFIRELYSLKRIADYSSVDGSGIKELLLGLGPDFVQYTYSMVKSGIERDDVLRLVSEDDLALDCLITNGIHRKRISQLIAGAIQGMPSEVDTPDGSGKCLDAFISYRRSNGSQLASLLKVHLQLRGFSVFIDVERLEAGKFDNNLLNSIQCAKNFVLVLTPNALDRCLGDDECADWVHKEISQAIKCGTRIIPIIDNFDWPRAEALPEDMRTLVYFNGVRWIHDYQDACVDKLERFLRGEMTSGVNPLGRPPLEISPSASVVDRGHGPTGGGGAGSGRASSSDRMSTRSGTPSTPSIHAPAAATTSGPGMGSAAAAAAANRKGLALNLKR